LEKVARLCELLDNPQNKLPIVHIAGTNGKGSTTAMVAYVLQAAGYKVGMYTSPYVKNMRDCTFINGHMMPSDEFAATTAQVREKALQMLDKEGHPTQFEIETAIAFLWFHQSNCDIVVLETGLGGRLDATNVVEKPLVSVITSISYDHMSYLGDTIEEITTEKCGILKPDGVTVSYPLQSKEALGVIREQAALKRNTLRIPDMNSVAVYQSSLYGNDIACHGMQLHIPLAGLHQVANALTALEAVFALRELHNFHISADAIMKGISSVEMPLRQEVLCHQPVILLDGAHNTDGARSLAESIKNNLNGTVGKDYEDSYGQDRIQILPEDAALDKAA
jgi:dihydrofolate synthase/folylpolyglutamate synthase